VDAAAAAAAAAAASSAWNVLLDGLLDSGIDDAEELWRALEVAEVAVAGASDVETKLSSSAPETSEDEWSAAACSFSALCFESEAASFFLSEPAGSGYLHSLPAR
jgi:hypothetical protein